jgi:Rod binding domain-containing protein
MSLSAIASALSLADPAGDSAAQNEAGKRTQSSRDFEALLIGQMLHSVREEGSGWLGSAGDDSGGDSSDAAFGLGEEQLAQAIAQGGGFGLGKFIDRALARDDSK